MKRAVIYARVSSERQRERHTIASQLSLLPGLVRQKDYHQVAEPYVDDGISGEMIEGRPAMTWLLNVEYQHCNTLLIKVKPFQF